MIQINTPQWFPVYVKSRQEKVAEAELIHRGYEVYLPIWLQKRRWSDRWKTVGSPLFPGYIFIHTSKNQKFPILEVLNIVNFISFKGEPATIPDIQIEAIRRFLERPESLQTHTKRLVTGTPVKITAGPFKGLNGTVDKLKNNARLYIQIDHLNTILSVEIDERDIIEYEPKKD